MASPPSQSGRRRVELHPQDGQALVLHGLGHAPLAPGGDDHAKARIGHRLMVKAVGVEDGSIQSGQQRAVLGAHRVPGIVPPGPPVEDALFRGQVLDQPAS